MNALRDMLSDADKRISSMRVICMLTTCTVLAVWTYSVIASGQWIPLDIETVMALATAQATKAMQAKFEIDAVPNPYMKVGPTQ